MLGDGVLQALPNRGLDQSILLAILIGLLTLLVLTETLGWGFVGLVVPGYLSSVFVIQSSMGITIMCEAITTYVLVRFISDRLSETGAWSPFFGRERFFLIVLMSVIVRQNSQMWIWPLALGWVDQTFGTRLLFDSSEFSSIGLVLVPLVANMFWKINVPRGLVQIGVPVLITYSLLQFVILPYTNLSFSSIEITYGNVALNFLNSPKAYLILLTAAILAARFNVLYGWDYNGILVPSLLALAWLEPWSIAVTVVEVLILFVTTKLVLSTPMLRTVNMEGPRQIALVFVLSFLLKYILAWVVSVRWPFIKVTDLFGFGYVITSLLTVKMLQKKVIGRVILPALQVSFVGFMCGSLIGFGLEEVTPRRDAKLPPSQNEAVPSETLVRSPLGVAAMATARVRTSAPDELRQGRGAKVLRRYGALWTEIDAWLASGELGRAERIGQMASSLGLVLQPLPVSIPGQGPAFALIEAEERLAEQTGWDSAVLIPGAPGPVLQVPRPLHDEPAAELAAVLCEQVSCRAIVISGLDAADGGRTAADALEHPQATLYTVSKRLSSAPIVQIRSSAGMSKDEARLYLHHKLPEEVNLKELWPGQIALRWSAPPGGAQSWRLRRDVLVLIAHPESMWRLLSEHVARSGGELPAHDGITLKEWLSSTFGVFRTIGVTQTRPSQSEIRFMDKLLASRLLERRSNRMLWLHHLAGLIDYQVVLLPECVEDTVCWVLSERARPVKHRWGSLAVRGDPAEPLAVEAPRPLLEAGTWEVALDLWKRARGFALIIGHDLPATHGSQPLDPARYGNVETPFQAMHQSVHRALMRQPAPTIAQVRGFATWRPITPHLIIGVGPPALEPEQKPNKIVEMLELGGALGWMKEVSRWARGEPELVSLAGQGNPQLSFSEHTGGVDFAMLWFSEPVRQLYLDEAPEAVAQRIAAVGFSLHQQSAMSFLGAPLPPPPAAESGRFEALLAVAEKYAVTEDVILLRQLREAGQRDSRVHVAVGWSTENGAPFLMIETSGPQKVQRAVVLLTEFAAECPPARAGSASSTEALAQELGRRCRTITTQLARPRR